MEQRGVLRYGTRQLVLRSFQAYWRFPPRHLPAEGAAERKARAARAPAAHLRRNFAASRPTACRCRAMPTPLQGELSWRSCAQLPIAAGRLTTRRADQNMLAKVAARCQSRAATSGRPSMLHAGEVSDNVEQGPGQIGQPPDVHQHQRTPRYQLPVPSASAAL